MRELLSLAGNLNKGQFEDEETVTVFHEPLEHTHKNEPESLSKRRSAANTANTICCLF